MGSAGFEFIRLRMMSIVKISATSNWFGCLNMPERFVFFLYCAIRLSVNPFPPKLDTNLVKLPEMMNWYVSIPSFTSKGTKANSIKYDLRTMIKQKRGNPMKKLPIKVR